MIMTSWITFCVYLIVLSPLVIDQKVRRKDNKARKKKTMVRIPTITFFLSNSEKKEMTIVVVLFATKQGKKTMVRMPSCSSFQTMRRKK
jgi:hypothetical protein